MRPPSLAALTLLWWVSHAAAQPAILQIQIVEGEEVVHPAGRRSDTPLVLAVTSETGDPVPGAAVTLQLPREGPSGSFGNDLPSGLILTGPDGRASLQGVVWGPAPGVARLRVTVVKDHLRAGTSFPLTIGPGRPKAVPNPDPAIEDLMKQVHVKGRFRWKWVVAAAAASGGGLAAAMLGAGLRKSAASPAPATLSALPLQIGIPTITVGRP